MKNSSTNIFSIGTVLNDKWVILESIGKGAMGEVYRAHQFNLKRDVAIKVISDEFLQSFEENEEEIETAYRRFRNEVLSMALISHPNVLQIFDFESTLVKSGTNEVNIEYIVMEYIPGATLRATMSEQGFSPEEDLTREWLLDYFLPILNGVQAMHNTDIIHRDLKPENVFIDTNVPKIADFGLAHSHRLSPVTGSMDVKGTLAYMSPEHYYDLKRADQRADIYSLGKMLYEAIEGRITSTNLPFKQVHLSDPKTVFFKELDRIIQKATAENKEERIESVDSLRKTLLQALTTVENKKIPRFFVSENVITTISKSKWTWVGIIIAILSVLIMTLWHIFGKTEKSNDMYNMMHSSSQRSQPIHQKSAEIPKPLVDLILLN